MLNYRLYFMHRDSGHIERFADSRHRTTGAR